jgi:hypothetical protein
MKKLAVNSLPITVPIVIYGLIHFFNLDRFDLLIPISLFLLLGIIAKNKILRALGLLASIAANILVGLVFAIGCGWTGCSWVDTFMGAIFGSVALLSLAILVSLMVKKLHLSEKTYYFLLIISWTPLIISSYWAN